MKDKKVSLTTVLLLLTIFILIIVILVGSIYFIYREYKEEVGESKEENVYNTSREPNQENNVQNQVNNEQNKNTLADMDVDELVYDASYDDEIDEDSFTYTYFDNMGEQKTATYRENSKEFAGIDFNTLKFPYININSEDVKAINEEIEDLQEHYLEEFTNYIELYEETENLNDDEKEWRRYMNSPLAVGNEVVSYSVYKYGNILSVVLKEGPYNEYGIIYHTYNIDLNTGKTITNNQLLKIANYSDESKLNSAVKKQIEKVCNNGETGIFGDNIEEQYNEYLEKKEDKSSNYILYWHSDKSLDAYNIQYFIDDFGQLNVITVFTFGDVKAGGGYQVLTLD